MPISVLLDKKEIQTIKGSSVQGVNGVWINADVRVFIPIDVLDMCNEQANAFALTQDEVLSLFDEISRLRRLRPHIFNDWETGFIDSMPHKLADGYKLSAKQKAKIKKIHEDFSVELGNLTEENNASAVEGMDDIPF